MSGRAHTVCGLSPSDAEALLRREIEVDLGAGDVTSDLVLASGGRLKAELVARDSAVLCGVELFSMAFQIVSAEAQCQVFASDGERMSAGDRAVAVEGPARAILAAERTALNMLTHLSGIATMTARYVETVAGTGAVILDTRKTLPGLRAPQKYAVRTGGGANHRMGLYDQVLIKDNHVAASGQTPAELAAKAASSATVPVEVEIDSVDELSATLDSGADIVLLDNFSLEELQHAVDLAREHEVQSGVRPLLEASGGILFETVAEIARTGVDRISIGALTHSAPVADFSLDVSKN